MSFGSDFGRSDPPPPPFCSPQVRESRFYKDILRHVSKAASRRARGLPAFTATVNLSTSGGPETPGTSIKLDSSAESIPASALTFFPNHTATVNLSGTVNLNATVNLSDTLTLSGGGGGERHKRPDIENVIRTVVTNKVRKLDSLIQLGLLTLPRHRKSSASNSVADAPVANTLALGGLSMGGTLRGSLALTDDSTDSSDDGRSSRGSFSKGTIAYITNSKRAASH
jgi:hypothetical protein